jgi:hypothetical protein
MLRHGGSEHVSYNDGGEMRAVGSDRLKVVDSPQRNPLFRCRAPFRGLARRERLAGSPVVAGSKHETSNCLGVASCRTKQGKIGKPSGHLHAVGLPRD